MDSAWEAIFMLLVLKIPVVYLAGVVWWAIRAEPEPADGLGDGSGIVPLTPCGWDDWKKRRPSRRGLHPLVPGDRPNLTALRRAREATA